MAERPKEVKTVGELVAALSDIPVQTPIVAFWDMNYWPVRVDGVKPVWMSPDESFTALVLDVE